MSGGCSNCAGKPACESRKGDMFASIDDVLDHLYPTRVWGQRRESEEIRPATDLVDALLPALRRGLAAPVELCPGSAEETCDYLYVLCVGREPGVLAWRTGAQELEPEAGTQDLYLRVALSAVAPFAAVQQSSLEMIEASGMWLIRETLRAGVFDPVLLPRLRRLVAVLSELGLEHLDFGEITTSPAGFDPGDYASRYGGQPAIANFLFYPQPCASVTTTVLGPSGAGGLTAARAFYGDRVVPAGFARRHFPRGVKGTL